MLINIQRGVESNYMNTIPSFFKTYLIILLAMICIDSFSCYLMLFSGIPIIIDPPNTSFMPHPDNFTQAVLWIFFHFAFLFPLSDIIHNNIILYALSIILQNIVLAFPAIFLIKFALRNKD